MVKFSKFLNKDGVSASVYKDIPIDLLDDFRKQAKAMGMKCKIVFRGHRIGHRSFCIRCDAKRFAVYPMKSGMSVFGQQLKG